MRELFNRRARAGGDQISTIFYMWEDLADNDNADAYVKAKWEQLGGPFLVAQHAGPRAVEEPTGEEAAAEEGEEQEELDLGDE